MVIRFKLGIRQKMLMIVGLSCLSLAGLGWYMLGQEQQLVRSERILMLSNITDSAITLADKINSEIQAGHISHDAGIAQLRDLLQTIRFGAAQDYILAYTMDGVTVANAGNPALDGKDMSHLTAPDGRMPVGEMLALTRANGMGVVEYLWPRPKDSNIPGPVMKLAYVRIYQPLGLMLGAAVYMDDINVELHQLAIQVIWALASVGAISIAVTILIASSILRPLATLGAQMQSLADGNAEIEISQTERRDEIGAMANTVAVFRTNALRVRSLAAEQEQLTLQTQTERRQTMLALANDFDQRINTLVEKVAAAADNMQHAATSLSTTAEQTSMQSRTVAQAVQQATVNVQTVAGATEQLAASIGEITRQVTACSTAAGEAVSEAQRSSSTVIDLVAASKRIGEVVALISGIAGQTNLLALNATIEAARAGDAGKGFAVVASEVKLLAAQTARATDEIGAQITAMQSATNQTAADIEGIGAKIDSISEIATTIAAAVEQQGAATRDIALNVQEAAMGTQTVSDTIDSVSEAAQQTGVSADQVLESAGDLSSQALRLKQDVAAFLDQIRAA